MALDLIKCPFCGEDDFDLIGLKRHLSAGWCEPFNETPVNDPPRNEVRCYDLSTPAKRNAFYSSDEFRNMSTAEKCRLQGDGFLNDYD